jgi:hypothetical protein
MATRVAHRDQLEVIRPDEPPDVAARGRQRRRWWWLLPGIGVLALAIAFPVRAAVGRAEVRGLERRWQASQSLISEGFAQIHQLRTAAGSSFASVIPAVFDEQANDLQQLLNQTRSQLVLDPPVAGLRRRIAQALQLEVSDLRRDTQYWRGPQTAAEPAYLTARSFDAQSRVERTLSSQLARLSLRPAAPRAAPTLKAAAAALARLSRIADQPIGARLVGLFTIDVDANRIDPVQLVGGKPLEVLQFVPRAGFVLMRAVGRYGPNNPVAELWAAAPSFTGPVTDLGPVDAVVAGERPDTYWVSTPDGNASELDGSFRVVRGPVELPPDNLLVGATPAGLLIAIRAPSGQSFTLEIIDPGHPLAPYRLVGSGVPLAVCGTQLIWFDNGARALVHWTDTANHVDHTIDPGPSAWPDGVWTCSPDNTRVAGAWFSLTNRPLDYPGVIDLRSGHLELTTGGGLDTQPGASSTVWTFAGDRVFFLGTLSSGSRQDPITFRPGDPDLAHLRLPGYVFDAIVPLP